MYIRDQLGTWTFKNDGTPFRQEDWNRLKKIGKPLNIQHTARVLFSHIIIAEGNPDEQKIGAFGVGQSSETYRLSRFLSNMFMPFRILLSVLRHRETLRYFWVPLDGILLERWQGSGLSDFVSKSRQHVESKHQSCSYGEET